MRMLLTLLLLCFTCFGFAAEEPQLTDDTPVVVEQPVDLTAALGRWYVVGRFNDVADPEKGVTKLDKPTLLFDSVTKDELVDATGAKTILTIVNEPVEGGTKLNLLRADRPTELVVLMTSPGMHPVAVVVTYNMTTGAVIDAVVVYVAPYGFVPAAG